MRYGQQIDLTEYIYDFLDISNTEDISIGDVVKVINNHLIAVSVYSTGETSKIALLEELENNVWSVSSLNEIDGTDGVISDIDTYDNIIAISISENDYVGIFAINSNTEIFEIYHVSGGDYPSVYDNYGKKIKLLEQTLIVSYDVNEIGRCDSFYLNLSYDTVFSQHTLQRGFGGLNEEMANDGFGSSIKIYSNQMVIGSPGKYIGRGEVYLYIRPDLSSNWVLWSVLRSPVSKDNFHFGFAVEINKDFLFVSAIGYSTVIEGISFRGVGAIYVYKFNGIDYVYSNRIQTSQEITIDDFYFGENLLLEKDELIVSLKNKDTIEIFNGEFGWSHTYSIDGLSNSFFGQSVSIGGDRLLVSDSDSKVFLFSLYAYNIRSFQSFEYLTGISRCSLYLSPIDRYNKNNYWSLIPGERVVIDAANTLQDIDGGFSLFRDPDTTGAGSVQGIDFCTLKYPIKTFVPRKYYIALRIKNVDGNIDILIDEHICRSGVIQYSDPYGDFTWVYTSFVLPDIEEHLLGIRLEGDVTVDKVIIDSIQSEYKYKGPFFTESPFLSFILEVFEGDDVPMRKISNTDNIKDTFTEIKQNGWYNFKLNVIYDSDVSINNFFVVASVAGFNRSNRVLWKSGSVRTKDFNRYCGDLIF